MGLSGFSNKDRKGVFYKSLYSEEEIRALYEQLQGLEIPEKFVFFNNTCGHSGSKNAAMLKAMVGPHPRPLSPDLRLGHSEGEG